METELHAYIKEVKNRLAITYKDTPDQLPTVEYSKGPKYWKIITTKGLRRSVHSFVERSTGDIYKPAGWDSPAKHARGNITTPDHGAGALDAYGVKYLR